MKVFGGAKQMKYEDPDAPPQMDVEHLETAIRFGLGTPGVATLNLGVHNREQLRQNVAMVKRFEPLTGDQQDRLRALGKDLAQEWGAHFGPVVEPNAARPQPARLTASRRRLRPRASRAALE
jgi:uncharacterized protein